MARKAADVYGFDELQKGFKKMEQKYTSLSDAMLATMANQSAKRLRQLTPLGPPRQSRNGEKRVHIKKSYRVLKPKEFKDGRILVSRVQNNAPHMHLVEYGHEMYRSPVALRRKIVDTSKRTLRKAGVTYHGRVDGKYLIDKVLDEYERRFPQAAKKIVDSIEKELDV